MLIAAVKDSHILKNENNANEQIKIEGNAVIFFDIEGVIMIDPRPLRRNYTEENSLEEEISGRTTHGFCPGQRASPQCL